MLSEESVEKHSTSASADSEMAKNTPRAMKLAVSSQEGGNRKLVLDSPSHRMPIKARPESSTRVDTGFRLFRRVEPNLP